MFVSDYCESCRERCKKCGVPLPVVGDAAPVAPSVAASETPKRAPGRPVKGR